MSKNVNITASDHYAKGEDKTLVFDVVDSAGAAQTMTGWALEFVLRRSAASATAVLTKTTGAAQITISNGDATDDRATVTITDDDTVDLVAGTYEYALRRTDSGNEQGRAFGTLELLQGATRGLTR